MQRIECWLTHTHYKIYFCIQIYFCNQIYNTKFITRIQPKDNNLQLASHFVAFVSLGPRVALLVVDLSQSQSLLLWFAWDLESPVDFCLVAFSFLYFCYCFPEMFIQHPTFARYCKKIILSNF